LIWFVSSSQRNHLLIVSMRYAIRFTRERRLKTLSAINQTT